MKLAAFDDHCLIKALEKSARGGKGRSLELFWLVQPEIRRIQLLYGHQKGLGALEKYKILSSKEGCRYLKPDSHCIK